MIINNTIQGGNQATISVSLAELLKMAEEKGEQKALRAVEQVRILRDICAHSEYVNKGDVMMVLGIEPEPEPEKGAE